jgi:hypothetical protein
LSQGIACTVSSLHASKILRLGRTKTEELFQNIDRRNTTAKPMDWTLNKKRNVSLREIIEKFDK